MSTDALQHAKRMSVHTTPGYHWRGMHPFYEQDGAQATGLN